MNKRTLLAALAATFLSFNIIGCDPPATSTGTQRSEEEQTEENQSRLVKSCPPPQFTQSLERENLKKRLEILNVQNKIGYVYLLGRDGDVSAFYTVMGKVSSLNSSLTTPQQIVQRWVGGNNTGGHYESHVVDSPDFDGSYGKNPEGIFFFTTDGTYVEWSGAYLYADKPLKIVNPIKLVSQVDLGGQK